MKRAWPMVAIPLASLLIVATGLWFMGCRSTGKPEATPTAARPTATRAAPRPLPGATRAVWVARFHYRYADDVRTIIRNCAALGCNTVYWQVRGEGTLCYPSQLEPWGREFDFRDPGFDPLALAVEEAHRYGLRIEAWVNVMPGWKGKTPPPIRGQLYNARPGWFLHDASGQRQPLNDQYVILNPCLPDVRRHIVGVISEIVGRYDVDGVHLDYVRFAWDGVPKAQQRFPRDPQTLSLYRRETGRTPDDDAAAWNHWRANQITRLVSEIRSAVNNRRPGASLTAAVWRNPTIAYNDYLQNGVAWLRAGLVDALMPMAYTEKTGQFDDDVDAYRRLAGGRLVVPGVGIYQHDDPDTMRTQLRHCQAWGGSFALFSYESLFATAGDRKGGPSPQVQRQREMRRAVLGEFAPSRTRASQ